MAFNHTPYFYVIGWTKHDRWYVGCRYAKACHPSDLMRTYFTSSTKYVQPFIEQQGLPDVVWTFPCKTADQAKFGERRIMNEFNSFLDDERWLNRNISDAPPVLRGPNHPRFGKPLSDSLKAKMIAGHKRTRGAEWRERQSIAQTGLIRAPRSEGHKGKLREAQRAKYRVLKFSGQRYSLRELSELTGIKLQTLSSRINRSGMSVEQAVAFKRSEGTQ